MRLFRPRSRTGNFLWHLCRKPPTACWDYPVPRPPLLATVLLILFPYRPNVRRLVGW
ncbi:protein of unknown function [Methylacidimicrobium sp. AP8]|nr:protein of unknown function [Methylacidimicrobium sp. AP8]